MNGQAGYFGTSAVFHLLLALALIAVSLGVKPGREIVTIDLDLCPPPPVCTPRQSVQQQAAPASVRQVIPREPVRPEAKPAGAAPSAVIPQPRAVPLLQPLAAAVPPPPVVGAARADSAGVPGGAAVSQQPLRTAVPSAPAGGAGGGEPAVEQARKRYLKEHFTYIRDVVLRRLVYPPVAMRMEWSGKVVLVFVVSEDGGVQSVRVRDSSGFPVLDACAVDTVKKAAPFPRPPVTAEIVMPVHFRLE